MDPYTLRSIQGGIILGLCLWVFTPAFHGEWLFDDTSAVLYNPVIHRVTGLWTLWFAPTGADYFPLKDSVQWLQWHLFGKATLGYHLTNVALHFASALLVWRLLEKLGVRLAWLGGLLFAVHPLTVESVAWICELKNTLALPLLLLAMLAYLQFDRKGDRRAYLHSIALFLASLLAKSSGVMFPVVILLYAWWRKGRVRLDDLKRSAPFFAVAFALGIVTIYFQQHLSPGGEPIPSLSPISRFLGAGLIIAFYISKFFWPADLDIVYFRWNVSQAAGWEIVCWLLLGAFTAWLITRRKPWARHTLFGLGFFVINLFPVLGFVRFTWSRFTWVSDHFMYLPMIGLIGLVVAAVSALYERWPRARLVLSGVITVVIMGLAMQASSQAMLFQSSLALWKNNIEQNPASWLGYNNLSVAESAAGDPADAIRHLQLSLRVNPGQMLAYLNWGNALMQLGRATDAMTAYHIALSLEPDYPLAHYQLGNALVEAGRLDAAIAEFQTAVKIDPNYAEAYTNLADVLIQAGRANEAVEEGERAIQIDPDYSDAHYNLGIALGQTGKMPEAAAEFATAARLSPDDPQIRYNLGIALLSLGKSSEALPQFQKALELDPHYAAARAALDRLQH